MTEETSDHRKVKRIAEMIEIDVEKLAAAYSEQNKQVNKRWALCAVTSLVAVNLKGGETEQVLFATTLNGDSIFPLVLIGLAMTNFVYVVAHISAYDASSMFLKYISENKLDTRYITGNEGFTGKKDSYADYLHATTASNYNRVYPIFKGMKFRGKNYILGFVKILIDFVQFSVVPLAMFSVIWHFNPVSIIDYFSIIIAILSCGISIILFFRSINHSIADKIHAKF